MSKFKSFFRKTIISLILIGSIYGLSKLYMDSNIAENIFAKGITRFISGTLSLISNLVPISIAEIIIYAFLTIMALSLIMFIIRLIKRRIFKAFKLAHTVFNFILFIVLVTSVTLSVMYNRDESFYHLDLTLVDLDDDLAFEAADFYADLIIELNDDLVRDENLNTINPYTIEELSIILNKEYKKLESDYFASYDIRVKGFYTSNLISYLGILGVYFPFTSEANINTNTFPYQVPTTMAHEMAHAKGVLRENEANFLAYYITLQSDDKFLKYSGAMDSLMILLRQLDQEKRDEITLKLPNEVKLEYNNASKHYANYEGFINELSSKINDTYLKTSGVSDGIRSYSRTAKEIASLYLRLKNN